MFEAYRGKLYRDRAAEKSPELVQLAESGELHAFDFEEAIDFYMQIAQVGAVSDLAYLGAVDRFFLLTNILGRIDAFHPWLYDRCREVEAAPDSHLDLWARYHYKSTIITFAGIIQEIINDPEITIGVFGHTKAIAVKFVAQTKREFEHNSEMRLYYPDICWLKPRSEAPIWSEGAYTVRRKGNPKEATVEGWGVVDGQPTSKHFALRIYDDMVTRESVTNPEQVKKTTESYELSTNLGTADGREQMIGTRYLFGDTYGELIARGIVTPRIYAATDNGKLEGKPVFLTQAQWDKARKKQVSTVNAQMLQNPLGGTARMFHAEWFKPWFVRPAALNVYIMADPSRGRTAKSDNTAIAVIGVDSNGNKYLLDGARKKMTLSQRWDHLKHYHKKWSTLPGVMVTQVGYERYGQQSDDEYFLERMRAEKYSFAIKELAWPREGGNSKRDRVERLQPDLQYGALLLPGLVYANGQTCLWEADIEKGVMAFKPLKGELKVQQQAKARNQGYLCAEPLMRKDELDHIYDLTRALIEEALYFPFGSKDDLIDVTSRIYDMEALPASTADEVPEIAATVD